MRISLALVFEANGEPEGLSFLVKKYTSLIAASGRSLLQSGSKRQLEPADEPGTLSVKWPSHVCLGVNMPLNVWMSTAADPLDVACDLLVNNRRRIAGGRITAASTEPTFYMLPVVFDTEQPLNGVEPVIDGESFRLVHGRFQKCQEDQSFKW